MAYIGAAPGARVTTQHESYLLPNSTPSPKSRIPGRAEEMNKENTSNHAWQFAPSTPSSVETTFVPRGRQRPPVQSPNMNVVSKKSMSKKVLAFKTKSKDADVCRRRTLPPQESPTVRPENVVFLQDVFLQDMVTPNKGDDTPTWNSSHTPTWEPSLEGDDLNRAKQPNSDLASPQFIGSLEKSPVRQSSPRKKGQKSILSVESQTTPSTIDCASKSSTEIEVQMQSQPEMNEIALIVDRSPPNVDTVSPYKAKSSTSERLSDVGISSIKPGLFPSPTKAELNQRISELEVTVKKLLADKKMLSLNFIMKLKGETQYAQNNNSRHCSKAQITLTPTRMDIYYKNLKSMERIEPMKIDQKESLIDCNETAPSKKLNNSNLTYDHARMTSFVKGDQLDAKDKVKVMSNMVKNASFLHKF
jgi:hypothetical protein